MANRAYSEINLHVVWHVKENSPILKDDIEMQLHRFLRGKAVQEKGAFWYDSGGTDDHVHLVVSIPPTIQISEWIGQLKGGSSHFISFGTKDLPWVLEYVRSQRKHHAAGKIHDRLERIETEDDKPPEGG